METFDVVVIGAGPGGYPAAIRAAQLGASVAIVEKEQLGGTCLNWGCIPTKALIAAADTFARIKHAEALGITVKGASVDYAVMIGHKNKVVTQLQGGIKQLLTANGVQQFAGVAAFKDRNTIAIAASRAGVSPASPQTIGARKVIIATGSTSVMPGFLPKHERVVESRGFLDLTRLPASMLVLGGGFIGCELACMAAMLGVKVTIVELLEDILLLLDPDVRREVRTHMEKSLGIRVLTGKALEKVVADAKGVTGNFGDEVLKADLLLSAIGRKPVTEGLKPENSGVKITERGFIEADDCCRTNVATIYAIGDVTGKIQLAHYATAQGIAAAENAVGKQPHKHDTIVPNVIFTAPEVGTVGLSEDDAKKQGRGVKTGKFRFAALGKALAVGETTGFVKWIADATTDQLLGAAAVGPHATELIAEAATAIRAELTVRELGRTIHAHPTFSEAWMETAHAVHGEAIHAPPKRKK
jgi:dihydrolipoamide dehydrogenase